MCAVRLADAVRRLDACALVAGCGQCPHQLQPGCCEGDAQCQDSDPCTKDGCVDASCQHAKVPGCCINGASALAACDDDDPCTQDRCLGSACRHVAPPGSCCRHDSDGDDGVDCTLDTSASFDNAIDLLGVTSGPGRAGLLRVAGGSDAWVQVSVAPPVAGYRAVASSIALAGVRPGALTPLALLARLLAFFDGGLPACAGASDCDDGDA